MPRTSPQIPPGVRDFQYAGEIDGEFNGRSLLSPQSIAFDQNGNVYIADTGNNRIVKLDRNFNFVQETGGFGSETGGLNRPIDIVSDGGINFFVLDQGNRRIIKLDYNLRVTDEIRLDNSPELLSAGQIAGIAYSDYARLFLLDPDKLRVLMLDTDYALERTLLAPGGFANCVAIAVDSDGNVFVYDEGDQAIYRFDTFGNADGRIDLLQAGELGDILVLGDAIIASDEQRNEMVVYNLAGALVTSTGLAGQMRLSSPTGVTIRIDGRLFVCDSGNNRVTYYEINPD
jgi:DNA-binding beta-propeller fold protein YncE